jgi:hypothetical protein
VLFIFDTILDKPEEHLAVSYENHDLEFGEKELLDKLRNRGYNLSECLDVSFKAYLSSLYLRNDGFEITLVIGRVAVAAGAQMAL